jgi:hypothetical protein
MTFGHSDALLFRNVHRFFRAREASAVARIRGAAWHGSTDAFAEQKGDPDSWASGMRGESGPPANTV